MLSNLLNRLKKDKEHWEETRKLFRELNVPAKTILLREGEISKNMYFIKHGCLRMCFNNDGKDITFQFFFENQQVSSIESFYGKIPSKFGLESIEPSEVVVLSRTGFDKLYSLYPDLKDGFREIMFKRMGNYADLFLSRIKDNPQKRYLNLLAEHPEIIQRVPQHYIASYLGITAVSLSRIRNKK